MGFETKPKLSNAKFEQIANNTLTLSGCTQIHGQLEIENGGTLRIDDGNQQDGYVLTSDVTGGTSWQEAPVTSASNGLTKNGNNIVLGGTLTGNTCINAGGFGLVIGTNATASNKSLILGAGYTSSVDIIANGTGSLVLGGTYGGGGSARICSTSYGSVAMGFAIGTNALLTSSGCGTLSMGAPLFNSSICSIGSGSIAMGSSDNNSIISANGNGSIAAGLVKNTSCIISCGDGSFAMGYGDGASNIACNTSFVFGSGVCAIGSMSSGFGSNINNAANCAIALGYGITLDNNTYSGTTAVNKLVIYNAPTINNTSDQVLVRNTTTGIIDYVSKASLGGSGSTVTANNGLTKIGNNIVLGGTLTGDTNINTGGFGLGIGQTVSASNNSFAGGSGVTGICEISFSFGKCISNNGECVSIVMGHNLGVVNCYNTNISHGGANSVIVSGNRSIGITNSVSAPSGPSGCLTSIFGGFDNVINGVGYNVTLIGTCGVTIDTASHNNYGVVQNLAIWDTPTASTCTTALVWDNVDRKVKINSSIGGSGSTVTANNGLTKLGNNIVLGGTLTGNTCIDTGGFGIVFGSSSIATGSYSTAFGCNTQATGSYSTAFGVGTIASGDTSFAFGSGATANGDNSFAMGNNVTTEGGGAFIFSSGCGWVCSMHGIAMGYQNCINAGNNDAIVLGCKIKVTGTSHGNNTIINNLSIWESPTTSSCVSALVWDGADKKVKINSSFGSGTGATAANNGVVLNGNTVSLGGSLTGNTNIDNNGYSFTIGSGNTVTGNDSFSFGIDTTVTGKSAFAIGRCSQALGDYSFAGGICGGVSLQSRAEGTGSFAFGRRACAGGAYSVAIGQNVQAIGNSSAAFNSGISCNTTAFAANIALASGVTSAAFGDSNAYGQYSFAIGDESCAVGLTSFASGRCTRACGDTSFSGGKGNPLGNKHILAAGYTSFVFSQNDSLQTAGHGALADNSVILGGINHNIEVGNTGATIIGGNTIKLTGTSYIDTTAVANLALMSLPVNNVLSDQVLVRNTTTGIIDYVSKASLGGSGSTTLTANNGLTKLGDNIVLGGTLTGNTEIDTLGYSFAIGNGTNSAIGINSFALGFNNNATGTSAIALGASSLAFGTYSFAAGGGGQAHSIFSVGIQGRAYGLRSVAIGTGSRAHGDGSAAIGCLAEARGELSFASPLARAYGACSAAFGALARSCSTSSMAFGQLSRICSGATHSSILGGIRNCIIDSTCATIIGGKDINVNNTTYNYDSHVIVPRLAIWSTPTGSTSTNVLVWDDVDKKVKINTSISGGTGSTGSNVSKIRIVTGNTTITSNDEIIIVKDSGGTPTISLPSSPISSGVTYIVKDGGGNALANNITLSGNGNNIDNTSSILIDTDYGSLEVAYDGSDWWVISFVN